MGRKPGSVMRCTCVKCGAIELRTGCTSGFKCRECEPVRYADSLQHQAHKAVANAIRTGALKAPTEFACADCGAPAIEYEHRDYYKPLDVEPVCRGCNLRRGPAVGAKDRVARHEKNFARALPETH
jgi:hypothetical protein